ncbi:hypothetical protein HID58_036800, partial [Brassica napus]
SHRSGSKQASTATAGSHPGAPLEEDAGQQISSFLGYGQAHTVDLALYPATRHNGYSNDFRTHTSLAPELRRMELKNRRSARTATVAKRLVFRLSRISKLTQLRAQSVTSRRPKGPRVIPTPLGSLALQKNQRRL